MLTVHYMKRGFFRRHGLALPHASLTNMKTSKYKKNKISSTQTTAIMAVGPTTPPAQETASQPNRQALPAIQVPAQPAANQRTIHGIQDTANKPALIVALCVPIQSNARTSPNRIIPLSKPSTALAAFLMPIQPNAKTFFVRNILLDKKSATGTTTQRILFTTCFTDLYAATILFL